MKKLLLISLALMIAIGVNAQQKGKYTANHPKKNVAVKKPVKTTDENTNMLELKANPTVKSGLAAQETKIGPTRYDLQSNNATQNRIYRWADGTIGAVWTFGLVDPSYADRGTGYNFYDGSAWGPEPSQRIEDVKVGWPSYSAWGPSGEIVTTHTGSAAGVKIAKRATKNSGTWELSTKTGPAGNENLLWPRSVTSGTNNEYLHLVGLTAPVANGGTVYNGQDGSLLYSRSNDGGATWQINNVQFPGTDTNSYLALGGDNYCFAQPKGNNLAFLYGEDWADLFLMKSTDNGNTWTKTVIFQHPYPKFKEATTLVTDTPWVVDGSTNVVLDNNGKAHVFFGCMRVLNDDLTDGTTSYFPYSDGIGYWNEDMPALETTNPDTLFAHDQLVAYTQDLNGNDTIFEFVDIALYYLSVTSMPNATIDDDGNIFLFFTSVMENLDNGNQNYRHVYGRAFAEGYWHDFVDITGSIIHNFDECVFPSVAASSDDFCYVLFQADEEPGLGVRGDEDPATDNSLILSKVSKADLLVGINKHETIINGVSQNIPNPATGTTQFVVNLAKASKMGVEVSNAMGQKVFSIPATQANAGFHTITLDLNNLTPGLYFYTVTANGHQVTKKMIVQ